MLFEHFLKAANAINKRGPIDANPDINDENPDINDENTDITEPKLELCPNVCHWTVRRLDHLLLKRLF
jgi:hypothetical protein